MASNKKPKYANDIFLSCEKTSEPLIINLCRKLKQVYGLRVWTSCIDAKHSYDLKQDVRDALENSQIFLCCITKPYTESRECIEDEIIVANNELRMPGILLLLEMMVPENFFGLKFTHDWPQFKIYENEEDMNKWTGSTFEELIDKIEQLLGKKLNRPKEGELNHIEKIFDAVQSAVDSSYRKKWKKVDSFKDKDNEAFLVDLQSDGALSIGTLKNNNKYSDLNEHLGDRAFLDKKVGNKSKAYRDLQTLMKFCFEHIGKSAIECINHNYGLFKVIIDCPITIEFARSAEKRTTGEIISAYFAFITRLLWIKIGYRIRNVVFITPPDYNIIERTQLTECMSKIGFNVLRIIPYSISQVLAVSDLTKKQKKYRPKGEKFAWINFENGPLFVVVYEILSNGAVQILGSIYESNVTKTTERAGSKQGQTPTPRLDMSLEQYVSQAITILDTIMSETNTLLITGLTRLDFTCQPEYSSAVTNMLLKSFHDFNLDSSFFKYVQSVDNHLAIVNQSKNIFSKEEFLIPSLECNIGYQHYTGFFMKICDRNSILPFAKEVGFPTLFDQQSRIQVEIFKGERPLTRNCEYIADLLVTGLPKLKAGEVHAHVKFDIDDNGVLNVSAVDSLENKPLTTTLKYRTRIQLISLHQQIIEAATNSQMDTRLANRLRYAAKLINIVKQKHNENKEKLSKIEAIVRKIIGQTRNMSIEFCDNIIDEIKLYLD